MQQRHRVARRPPKRAQRGAVQPSAAHMHQRRPVVRPHSKPRSTHCNAAQRSAAHLQQRHRPAPLPPPHPAKKQTRARVCARTHTHTNHSAAHLQQRHRVARHPQVLLQLGRRLPGRQQLGRAGVLGGDVAGVVRVVPGVGRVVAACGGGARRCSKGQTLKNNAGWARRFARRVGQRRGSTGALVCGGWIAHASELGREQKWGPGCRVNPPTALPATVVRAGAACCGSRGTARHTLQRRRACQVRTPPPASAAQWGHPSV